MMTISYPESALPLSSGTGNVLLEKGNAGSGNEIRMMWFSRHIF